MCRRLSLLVNDFWIDSWADAEEEEPAEIRMDRVCFSEPRKAFQLHGAHPRTTSKVSENDCKATKNIGSDTNSFSTSSNDDKSHSTTSTYKKKSRSRSRSRSRGDSKTRRGDESNSKGKGEGERKVNV